MMDIHIMNFTSELEEHKKRFGNDWAHHSLKMISSSEKEAKRGVYGYLCPLCGLHYFFSDKSNAQIEADRLQEKHLKKCERTLKDGKLY